MKVHMIAALVMATVAAGVAASVAATYPSYGEHQSCRCSREEQCSPRLDLQVDPDKYHCGDHSVEMRRLSEHLEIDCNGGGEVWEPANKSWVSASGVFSCAALPILLDPPLAPLPELLLDHCMLPPDERVNCSLEAGAASSVRKLKINEGRSVPTEHNLRGLDLEEVWWTFQRDVVRSIPVEPLAQFQRLQKVTLHLGFSNVTVRAGMFSELTSVWSLELSKCAVQHLPAGAFSGMSNLTDLHLFSSQIYTVHQDAFQGVHRLEVLNMNHNPVRELPRDLRHTPALCELYLRRTDLSALNDTVFRGAPHLRKIEIECNNDEDRRLQLSNHTFSNLTSLRHLVVDNCAVTSLPPDIFAGSTSLVNISLNFMNITRVPVGLLSGLKHLKLLDLRANRIDGLQVGLFSGLGLLEKIDLSQNKIKMIPESAFSELPRLTTVVLRDNKVHTLSATAFRALHGLQMLDLSENELREGTGWGWLAALPHLTWLGLNQNCYTNISVAEMNLTEPRNRTLSIELRDNPIYTASPAPAGSVSSDVHLLLDGHHFNCDCHLYPLVDSLRTYTNSPIDSDSLKNAKCAQPSGLKSFSVLKVLHKNFSCEFNDSNCDCSYRPSLRSVECNCSNIDTLKALRDSFGDNTTMSLRLPYIPPKLPEFVVHLIVSRRNLTTANLTSIPNVPRLDLTWNNIIHIPEELLHGNITLELAGNPLRCDCETIDFVKRLKSLGDRLIDSDNVTCNSNYELLKDKNPDDLCVVKNSFTTTVVVVLLLMFAVGTIAYFRLEIVYLVYAQCICRRIFFRRPDGKSNKIFVSYSPENEHLVVEANDHLEGRNVLLHENMTAGLLVTPQIQKAVESSSIVLILLTEQYIASYVGRVTLQIAHNAGANMVVLLKGVQLNDLPVDITTNLSTAHVIPDRARLYRARFAYAMRPCAL